MDRSHAATLRLPKKCSAAMAVAGAVVLISLTCSPVAASNPLMKSSDRVEVVADKALDDVKGSGYYANYYGYYGNLYAYYAYLYSYYARYYYPSNSSSEYTSYYNAYQYSAYAASYNYVAYVYSVYGY